MLYLWRLLPDGVGVGADTVIYYAAAENLLKGAGLTMPFSSTFAGAAGELMTHFPPFYPVLLALLGSLFADVAAAAWLLSIALFGAMIVAVGSIMHFYCPHQPWIAFLAALLTLSSAAIIRLHTVALSEPLFILCWLLGFFLLARYLSERRTGFLLAAGLLLALSFLTRFSGLAFIATAGLWLLYRRRWQTAVFITVISILPMVGWLVYGSLAGNATNRAWSLHWLSSHHIWQGVYTMSAWFAPDILPFPLRLVVWLTLLAGLAWFILKRQLSQVSFNGQIPDFFKLLLLTIPIYLAQIVLSISFLDVQVRLSPRILSPVYLAALLSFLYGVSVWWPEASRTGQRVVTAVGAVICLAYFTGAIYTFIDIQQHGEHYTSREWQRSETLAYLQTIDGRTPLVSNGPDLIYFYTGLPLEDIPAEFKDTSLLPNTQFEEEMAQLAKQLQRGTQLVYLDHMEWRWFLPNQDKLTAYFPLRAVYQFEDGTIYAWDGE